MADGYGYAPLTSSPVPTAEDIARERQAKELQQKEINKRRDALLEEARLQAELRDKRQKKQYSGQKSHPRTQRPKTVNIDGVETPIDEAIAKIPERIDFENRILSSRITQRALAESRTET